MASNYPTVYYGSYGETVKQLQQALNQVGYSLDVDGGFGEKTRAAVLDYQRKNGLRVDGVAGSETMGSLLARLTPATSGPSTSGQVLSGVSDETMSRMRQLEKGYTPSDEVTAARALWESLQGQKPGEYESRFQQQLAALYDQISSRKPYAYDPEQDADYQRYARLYQRQGQAAMEDTMGQAAALSGGYGSSYAQQTGQQAYSQYLSELSALIPELEKQARSRYEQQGQALMDRYGLLQQAEQVDYSRWQDQLKAWQSDSDRAYEYYNSVGKEDRDLYSTMLKYYAGKAAELTKANIGAADDLLKLNERRELTISFHFPKEAGNEAQNLYLERAMGNYLKAGDTRSAQNLITLYKERMTPTQKKRFSALFDKYGAAIGW